MVSVSVIVITKNEAENIRDCLESVKWADELIVVDSGSTDTTRDICREYTDKVHETEWPGFGPQKNRALGYASKDWVLSMDADERVSEKLRDEINKTLIETDKDAFAIPRLSSYCGKFICHSGWRPDYVTRLFRREKGRFSDDMVHERVIVNGAIGKLTNDIIHYTYRNLEQVLDTVNRYSTLSSEQKCRDGDSSGLLKAVLHGIGAFISAYILRAGFLDGRHGFMLAVSSAEGAYYKYLKLMELCKK
jgi:glycosyltransferase involved in cell wall biosynthesis